MANKIKKWFKKCISRADNRHKWGYYIGTPVPMLGAVNLSLKGLVVSTDIAADDNEVYVSINRKQRL